MSAIYKARRLLAPLAVLLALLSAPVPSFAQLTNADLVLLPDYCRARMEGQNSTSYQTYARQFGETNFLHIHHYCYGLNALNRAKMEFEPHKQKATLNRAIREFNYVLKRWPKNFSLTPTAMMYKAHAETKLIMVP